MRSSGAKKRVWWSISRLGTLFVCTKSVTRQAYKKLYLEDFLLRKKYYRYSSDENSCLRWLCPGKISGGAGAPPQVRNDMYPVCNV
jgi:hypothetical protein